MKSQPLFTTSPLMLGCLTLICMGLFLPALSPERPVLNAVLVGLYGLFLVLELTHRRSHDILQARLGPRAKAVVAHVAGMRQMVYWQTAVLIAMGLYVFF